MRCGPGSCSALLNWSASSSEVLAVLAGTPIPRAMATKFMSGLDRSSSSSAFGPASAVPTRCSSSRRIAYERLDSTTVVTFNPSRAIVHSAGIVYIALPSDCRHTVRVRRAGHHTLEKSQHSAHLRHRIEACPEVHLRGTRVGEADIHAAANQCADKGQCTIHGIGLGSVI